MLVSDYEEMTYHWKDANSILEHVKKATDKLNEIEITPKIKEVLPVMGQIVDFAARFAELSPDERHQVDQLCWKVCAYLNMGQIFEWFVGTASDSPEGLQDCQRNAPTH